MVIEYGYCCKKCKKIYHKSKQNLPMFCKKCGEELIDERYWYNLTRDCFGRIVETKESNLFGGYDFVKTTLTNNVEKCLVKRKFLFWWEYYKTIGEASND